MKKRFWKVLVDTIKSACPFLYGVLFVSSFALPAWWATLLVQLLAAVLFFWYKWTAYASGSVYYISFAAKKKDGGKIVWCAEEYRIRFAKYDVLSSRLASKILSDHREFEDIVIISINKLG